MVISPVYILNLYGKLRQFMLAVRHCYFTCCNFSKRQKWTAPLKHCIDNLWCELDTWWFANIKQNVLIMANILSVTRCIVKGGILTMTYKLRGDYNDHFYIKVIMDMYLSMHIIHHIVWHLTPELGYCTGINFSWFVSVLLCEPIKIARQSFLSLNIIIN